MTAAPTAQDDARRTAAFRAWLRRVLGADEPPIASPERAAGSGEGVGEGERGEA